MNFVYDCNKKIEVTRYHYVYDAKRRKGFPAGDREPVSPGHFRILQVSDLQSEYFGEGQLELLSLSQELAPDLILLTGDLLDRSHTDYRAACRAASGFAAQAPVYYIAGNHEADLRKAEWNDFQSVLKETGIHVLLDKAEENVLETPGGSLKINLIGLSEYTVFRSRGQVYGTGKKTPAYFFIPQMIEKKIDELRETLSGDGLTILLAHEPQYFTCYCRPGIDLIFSGHAHGGQFRLPGGRGLFAPGQGVLPKLTSGMHRRGDAVMIVSRGLGNSSFPLRLHNRPELVVSDIEVI